MGRNGLQVRLPMLIKSPMSEKKPEMTWEQRTLLASRGLIPGVYEVLQDYPHSMIVRNKQTKQPVLIKKEEYPGVYE